VSINFCAAAKPDDPPLADDDPPAGAELLPPPPFDELEHAASTAHAVSAAPILTRDFTIRTLLISHDNAWEDAPKIAIVPDDPRRADRSR